jgi:hypothetical protein
MLMMLGLLIVSAQAAPTNLATGGTANVSSTVGWSDAPASALIDGNRSGVWGSGEVWASDSMANNTPANSAHYMEADLGSDMYLDRVQLFSRTDATGQNPTGIKVEAWDSTDTLVYSQVISNTLAMRPYGWGDIGIRGITAQRVRITDTYNQNYWNSAEMEVYGQSTSSSLVNLAAGKTVTGLSGETGNLPGIVDGKIDGDGVRNGSGSFRSSINFGSEIVIDLGATSLIDYITVFDRTDSDNTKYVTVSVLDASMATVTSYNLDYTTASSISYDWTNVLGGVSGRYVKVETPSSTPWFDLAEVEVFGTPEPATIAMLSLGGLFLARRKRR